MLALRQRLGGRLRLPGGSLDSPISGATLPRGPITIAGWALFRSGPARRVDLWLGDEPLGQARLGLQRPDIGEAAGEETAAAAGFEHTFDLAGHTIGGDGLTVRATATGAEGEQFDLPPITFLVSAETGQEEVRERPRATTDAVAGPPGGKHRVLVCTHQLDLGGAQTFLVQMVRGLAASGAIEAGVLTAAPGPLAGELEAVGIPVHFSTAPPIHDLDAHRGRVEELTAWARPRGFDAVIVNTATALAFPGAEVAAALGIPAIWFIHESFPPSILWHDCDPGVRAIAESTLAQAARAIFEAEATQRLFEQTLDPLRCLTLPYGLDIAAIDRVRAGFDHDEARRGAGIDPGAEVILCVGTVEPRKAQIPLAQAFDLIADRHPSAELVFLGGLQNANTQFLAEWKSSLASSDRIRVLEMTPDPQEWYGISDLLVCASDIESLPRAVLEAMAWELPVLATSIFGLPELIDDGVTGWLCPPRDVAALAAALDRVLGQPAEDRREVGRRGREHLERRHDLGDYCRRVAALLGEVTARGTL